jgi:hypothetical protein
VIFENILFILRKLTCTPRFTTLTHPCTNYQLFFLDYAYIDSLETIFPLLSDCITTFSWLPEHVTLLARFSGEPSPVKSTVTKAVAEFRRTHADTWNVQKELFTEEQLEVAFYRVQTYCAVI